MAKKKKTFPRKLKNQSGDDVVAAASTPNVVDDEDEDLLLSAPSAADQTLSSSRVILVGMGLVGAGMLGFYYIPGLLDQDAKGDRLVNAFYCSAITLTT